MKVLPVMINPSEMANIARTEETLWWFRGMRAISFALLDPVMATRRSDALRVLEAGCGTGFFAAALEQRYRAQVTALDLNHDAVEYCSRRPRLHPAQASVAALPFCTAAFDLVTSMDVLVHFPPGEERTPFAELVRVVKPGGWLLARVAALNVFRSRHSEFVWERQRLTRPQLQALARNHPLRISRLTYANFLLTPAAFLKFRLWEPLLRRPPSSALDHLPAGLDQLLYLPLALERWWLAQGRGFPWGQSLFLLAQKH